MTNLLSAGSEASFELYFAGPAVESQMDVRDLAPALLNVANLFQNLNRLVNPADPDVVVNIRATEGGSFDVLLNLAYLHTEGVLTSGGVVAALNLHEMVDQTGRLIDYVKRKFHHGVTSEVPAGNGNTTISFGDHTTININQAVLGGAGNSNVQDNLAAIADTVKRPGIDRMVLRRDHTEAVAVESEDADAFKFETTENVINRTETTVVLQVVKSDYTRGKWRFNDGMTTYWAAIEDENFNAGIDANERLGKKDKLRCRVRDTQSEDEEGKLHRTVVVVEVLEVLAPPTQQTFLTGA